MQYYHFSPRQPCLKIPRAKDTCVDVGPGMHWQRARSSRKMAEENQLSLSTKVCKAMQRSGPEENI
jgi:hypothetical protein